MHIQEKQITQKQNCTCGKNCISCDAENLSVSCGCDMESKQYDSLSAPFWLKTLYFLIPKFSIYFTYSFSFASCDL